MTRVIEIIHVNGYMLNPDTIRAGKILMAINRNEGYCPCRPLRDATTKCPCVPFKAGMGCECSLYVKED